MGFYVFIFTVGYGLSEMLILALADGMWQIGLSLGLLAGIALLSWAWGGMNGDNPAWNVFTIGAIFNIELALVHFLGWLAAAGIGIGGIALFFAAAYFVGTRRSGKPLALGSLPSWYRPRSPEAEAGIKAALAEGNRRPETE